MEAQFELATSALIGGLTNVSTITCAATEINAQPYLGIGVNYSNHQFGHMGGNRRDAKGVPYYEKCRGFVFGLIAKMAQRPLEATPEGDGNMLDNTLIIYMSDAPDTHHSTASEWPLAMVGNLKGKLNLGGKYISFPGYGKPGHHTVGALYKRSSNVQATSKKKLSSGLIQTWMWKECKPEPSNKSLLHELAEGILHIPIPSPRPEPCRRYKDRTQACPRHRCQRG